MTTPQHDPERDAAAYLGGDLPPVVRAAFETHMLTCDPCWTEVSEARTGRALAEALREAAPQDLRELLRTIAASAPERTDPERAFVTGSGRARFRQLSLRTRTGRIVAAAASVAVLAVGVTTLIPGSSNPEASLVAAAALYQTHPRDADPAPGAPPVRSIDGMSWRGSVQQSLAGQPAVVHRYADAAGHRVLLMSSTVEFPRAVSAKPVGPMGKNWIATIGRAVMFCAAAYGLSWLVLADSDEQALAAGRAAGLA